jgi:uncharacterized membrane protein
MKTLVLCLSIFVASGILFANIYTSLVDARSWASDIPNSIVAAREYFKAFTPANFFRIFSPLNQIIAAAALALFWKMPQVRWYCLGALVLYVLTDAMTFAYFYPRNDVMFKTAPLHDTALLTKTVSEWATMNWVRSAFILAGVVCSFLALHKSYEMR